MTNVRLIPRLRTWLSNIPINDPINRQMAVLLQVILFGFIGIVVVAAIINLAISTEIPWQVNLIRTFIFVFLIGIPLALLRHGYFRAPTFIIIGIFLTLETFAVISSNLRDIAETLSFFTLAIVLAGLLLNQRVMMVIYLLSAGAVLFGAYQATDVEIKNDGIVVAGNFILLNGLMSLFLGRFGLVLRKALNSALEREEELKNEINVRKQVEAERVKLIHELEKNNAELERFTYTVSHDLRSPLVTIKGFLGMLEKDIREGQGEKIQDDFQRISNATSKMETLLSELLELSRIGRVINPPVDVEIAEITREAVEALNARLQEKKVKVNISTNLPIVHGDRIRLREVMQNLIDNAAKYTGNQTTSTIEIGAREQNGSQAIFVKDNGIGIDPQYHTKIFNLFEKLDPESEGTGVGLALIKRIVDVHGGRIWVESDGPGKGSTFLFTIPDKRTSQD